MRRRAVVERIEMLASERPTASWKPVTRFEVTRIETTAFAAPHVARAAERSHPRLRQILRHITSAAVRVTQSSLPVIERLVFARGCVATTLEHENVHAGVAQFARNRDPSHPAADDAKP